MKKRSFDMTATFKLIFCIIIMSFKCILKCKCCNRIVYTGGNFSMLDSAGQIRDSNWGVNYL